MQLEGEFGWYLKPLQVKLLKKREKGASTKLRKTPKFRGHMKEMLEKEREDRFVRQKENVTLYK